MGFKTGGLALINATAPIKANKNIASGQAVKKQHPVRISYKSLLPQWSRQC